MAERTAFPDIFSNIFPDMFQLLGTPRTTSSNNLPPVSNQESNRQRTQLNPLRPVFVPRPEPQVPPTTQSVQYHSYQPQGHINMSRIVDPAPIVLGAERNLSSNTPITHDLLQTNREEKSIPCERYKDLDTIKERELECPICLCVISGTVSITICLHKFCSACLVRHLSASLTDPRCPMCRHELTMDDIILSEELTSYLDNCTVTCRNMECRTEVQRKDYYNHIASCSYNKKECKECRSMVYEKDFEKHSNECEHRLLKCNLCRSFVQHRKQQDHRENYCPNSTIKCPNEKCNYRTQRCKIFQHTPNCSFRTVVCANGCQSLIEYKELSLHNEICLMKKVPCEFCSKQYPQSTINAHHQVCPKKLNSCQYCSASVLNSSMLYHHRVCDLKPVKCPNECGQEVERRALLSHDKECSNRSVPCEECKQYYILSRRDLHDQSCSNKRVLCSDCNESIIRKDLIEHGKVCLYKYLHCRYSYAGCVGTFLRTCEKEHYENHKDHHLSILENYINKCQSNNKKFSNKNVSFDTQGTEWRLVDSDDDVPDLTQNFE